MEYLFDIEEKDIVDILTEGSLPWNAFSSYAHECLVFWKDGEIWITSDQFGKNNTGTYECSRLYSLPLCNTVEEYQNMSKDLVAQKAYNAWMNGAR